ncbi:MAG: hypothetical protein LBD94_03445 [Rickettsiales bacterium]|jgi:hypothetical protein|nr:hypothetical protein [Rickettsiales bacterium]
MAKRRKKRNLTNSTEETIRELAARAKIGRLDYLIKNGVLSAAENSFYVKKSDKEEIDRKYQQLVAKNAGEKARHERAMELMAAAVGFSRHAPAK